MRNGMMLLALLAMSIGAAAAGLEGAWQHERDDGALGTWIVSGEHFSIAWYRKDPAEFVSTEGGSWTSSNGELVLTYEFDTATPDRVGTTRTLKASASGRTLDADGQQWTRLDDGSPGALHGAWLMTGRVRDGEMQTRKPGARRTMKILSGTRFQWIAYNVETKEFFGSGGGTYTTAAGKYVESIDFFSRDASRVGASLEFTYELVDGAWHHKGMSSKGDPMHEVWTTRKDLGM